MKRDEFTTAAFAHSYPQHELRARIDYIIFDNDEEPAEQKLQRAKHFLALVDNYDDVMCTYWYHKLMYQSGCGGYEKLLHTCKTISEETYPDLEELKTELDAFPTWDD